MMLPIKKKPKLRGNIKIVGKTKTVGKIKSVENTKTVGNIKIWGTKILCAICWCFITNSHAQILPSMPWSETREHLPSNQPIDGLSDADMDKFILGRSFFTITWVAAPSATTARDGLGPLFNANACVACHRATRHKQSFNDDGNHSRILVFKLSQPNKHHYGQYQQMTPTDSIYGSQLAVNGIHGVPFEAKTDIVWQYGQQTLADGTVVHLRKPIPKVSDWQYGAPNSQTRISLRIAPLLVGLGLLQKIPDEDILSAVDEKDSNQDGIYGKVNYAPDIGNHDVGNTNNNRLAIGRFGHKASMPSVLMQTADAAINDMGLTNPLHPNENCTWQQTACVNAPRPRPTPEGDLDLPMGRLQAIAFYLQHLKAPKNIADNSKRNGQALFKTLQCATCHTPIQKTHDGIIFQPYSNLLLHDMGPDLADARPEYDATPQHWRTTPLWGLGAKSRANIPLLHDGRANTVTEAILWHGGEAEQAKQAFIQLNKTQRHDLLDFLNTL